MPISHERPVSPLDGFWLKDDFLSNDSVADAVVGELGWEIVTIGGASTYVLVEAAAAGEAGVLRQTTAGTTAQGSNLRLDEDSFVFGPGGGGFAFKFRYPTITGNALAGNNFRIGLNDSVTVTAPTVGIWIESDAGVLSLEADSADHGDSSVALGGVSTLTSGTTAVIDTWHTCRVEWTGANGQGGPRYVEAYVDGEIAGAVFATIDDDEEAEPKITHWNDVGDTLDLDLDFIEFWSWR
jgi:hypothetical protein